MSLLPASGEFLFGFPSPRHLSSSGSHPSDLSGLGDPTGSNATAGLALRVTGTHKPLYHGKVKIPTYLEQIGSVTGKLKSLKLNSNKFCHTKTVGDRANLITYLNSAWIHMKYISFYVTKTMFTSVISNMG
jgi:hypothetical protein